MAHVVVIGSSPIQMVRAAVAAKAADVTVVEAGAQLGGSWTTTDVGSWRSVETACHLLEPNEAAAGVLSDDLEVEMRPMVPTPKTWLAGRHPVPYDSRRAAAWGAAGASVRSVQRRLRPTDHPRPPRGVVAGYLRDLARGPGHVIPYVEGGVGALNRRLAEVVVARGGHIELNRRVHRIVAGSDRSPVRVEGSAGVMSADLVLVSSGLHEVELDLEGRCHHVQGDRVRHTHLIIEVVTTARPISYERFPGSSLVRRVTDVTGSAAWTVAGDPPSRLVLVNLRSERVSADAYARPDESVVVQFLVDHGILDAPTAVTRTEWVEYVSTDSTTVLESLLGEGRPPLAFRRTYGDLMAATAALAARPDPVPSDHG
jgi:Flavin containing amine oxidoreductase